MRLIRRSHALYRKVKLQKKEKFLELAHKTTDEEFTQMELDAEEVRRVAFAAALAHSDDAKDKMAAMKA